MIQDESLQAMWTQAIEAERQRKLVDPTWVLLLITELGIATNIALESQKQLVALRDSYPDLYSAINK